MTYASTPPPPAEAHPARRHLAALIIGCLLILPGLGLLLGGAGVAGTYAFGRDDSGFLSMTVPTLRTPTAAITVEDIVVEAAPDVPAWVLDRLDLDLRVTARSLTPGAELFVGVAPADALTAYLDGVAHDQVVGISEPRSGVSRAAVLRRTPGEATVAAPTDRDLLGHLGHRHRRAAADLGRHRWLVGRRADERRRQSRRRRVVHDRRARGLPPAARPAPHGTRAHPHRHRRRAHHPRSER